MDLLEGVPVLESLEDHAIFDCQWCGHIELVRRIEPQISPCWMGILAGRTGAAWKLDF